MLREQILSLGRKRQSAQTGFIHLNYQDPQGPKQDTVPVVENFLFALCLLRSRLSEQMLEARELLHKLLPFQSHEGNFPIYLHEYPQCKELFTAAKLLPPLYWIVKDFGSVAGSEVKGCLKRALDHCLTHLSQAPAHLEVLIKGAGKGDLEKFNCEDYWYSPTMLGALIAALQMNPSLSWPKFWTHLSATWHSKAGRYVGPHLYDARYEQSPFSLFYEQVMSGKALSLYAALMQPVELPPVNYPIFKQGVIGGLPFEFHHNGEAAAYFVPRQGVPLQYVFEDGALQLITSSPIQKTEEGFLLSLEPDQVDHFALEFDLKENSPILINGERGTVFQMGDRLEAAGKEIAFRISKAGGAGNVLGHLSLAPPAPGFLRKWVVSLRSVAVAESVEISLNGECSHFNPHGWFAHAHTAVLTHSGI
jgi:hypothetical protein